MKAAVVPAVNAKWEVKDVPTPKPQANQVLIKIHASGLCYTDVHITHGAVPTQFPRTLGHEPVGEIVELGPGVTTREIRTVWVCLGCRPLRPMRKWCQRGKPMFCAQQIGTGIQTQGSHAEYMVAYADSTALLPEGLSYEQAAPIFCAGYTVWSGLRWADPKPHERIAVVGIGGLGHLALQYSKAAGFETIAISHSPDKDKLARQLGADEVVRDGKGLAEIGGADVVLGTSNSMDATASSIQGLRPDGRLVVMGVEGKPLSISPLDLLMRRIRVLGSQQNSREYLYEALDYVAKGKVKVVAETYKLDEIGRAYDRVANGQVRFRAVITV